MKTGVMSYALSLSNQNHSELCKHVFATCLL